MSLIFYVKVVFFNMFINVFYFLEILQIKMFEHGTQEPKDRLKNT